MTLVVKMAQGQRQKGHDVFVHFRPSYIDIRVRCQTGVETKRAGTFAGEQ